MSIAFKTEFDFYDYCFKFAEDTSLRILEESSGVTGMKASTITPKEDFTHDHWVCSVTVALGEAKVYVKAHFDSKTARRIASNATQISEDGLPTSVLIDFMREYLNRIMGEIKGEFLSVNDDISVPEVNPSYDEGIGAKQELDINSRFWKVEWAWGQIILGCYINALGDVTSIQQKDPNDDEDNNIEFLK